MKKVVSLMLVALLILSFAGCKKQEPENPYKNYKIAMVSDRKGTDQFLLQAYNELVAMAEEYGFEYVSIECKDDAERQEKPRTLCEQGYNLIIGVGWNYASSLGTLADDFPDVKFGIIDTIAQNEKIHSAAFNVVNGAYVLGAMVAAAFPDDRLFGYIGNFDQQSNFEYRYGFEMGVRSLIPDAKFVVNFTNDYGDTQAPYNFAYQQQAAGCRFIMGSVANAANSGIYTAALELAEKGTPIYTSGLSVDQTTSENPYIIGGLTKNTAVPMRSMVEAFLKGEFTGGSETLGVTENAFCVVGVNFDANYRNTDIVTDAVIEAGKKALQDLKDGKVVLQIPEFSSWTED
ncbi:MAG: BMP family ABC transporter substrate-binding protein [Erysipelotrichaceae bacterium]|nr:BMP family ABC transporter substrate-binding protein [Erysipelotrichaceae bacterium]